MYDPKYDLPLAVGLSLAVSLIATYVTADNSVNLQRFVEGALASPPDVEPITPSPSIKKPTSS